MTQPPVLEQGQKECAARNEDEQDLQQLAIKSASQPIVLNTKPSECLE